MAQPTNFTIDYRVDYAAGVTDKQPHYLNLSNDIYLFLRVVNNKPNHEQKLSEGLCKPDATIASRRMHHLDQTASTGVLKLPPSPHLKHLAGLAFAGQHRFEGAPRGCDADSEVGTASIVTWSVFTVTGLWVHFLRTATLPSHSSQFPTQGTFMLYMEWHQFKKDVCHNGRRVPVLWWSCGTGGAQLTDLQTAGVQPGDRNFLGFARVNRRTKQDRLYLFSCFNISGAH